MRAWTFASKGLPADVLKLRTDLPQPSPKDLKADEILVKVSHVGIFQGFATMMGILPHINNKPWYPDLDFAGTAMACGSNVSHLKEGDAIFGGFDPSSFFKYGGALAEYIIVPAKIATKKPTNITSEEAGGIASCGATAVQFLDVTKAQFGQKVLVTGGSGGTGSLVVQAMKAVVGSEGWIVTTCSGANVELVKSLGADEVIDYNEHPVLHEYLEKHHSSQPFDAIVDLIGSDEDLYPKCPAYLKPQGMFLFAGKISMTHNSAAGILGIIGWVLGITIKSRRPVVLGGVPRRCTFHSARVDEKTIEKLAAMIEKGQMRGVVDSVWEMEDALKAYEKISSLRTKGKAIIHVQD